MFYREHTNEASLGTAIYRVFEAMKLGTKAPGVGEKFSLHIASYSPNVAKIKWMEIRDAYYEFLERQFATFGPKKMSEVQLKPKWIEETIFEK